MVKSLMKKHWKKLMTFVFKLKKLVIKRVFM